MSDGLINIKKYIIHILDSKLEEPLLSDVEHPDSDESRSFVEKHIKNFLENIGIKKSEFNAGENNVKILCDDFNSGNIDFLKMSREIATTMHDFIRKNPDIPSCDLISILFEKDRQPFLGFLKLNYKTSFIHVIEQDSSGILNRIVKQQIALPTEKQRIEEGFVIDLKNYEIDLLEKKYDIDGEKDFYISKHIIDSKYDISNKDKISIVNKITRDFAEEHFHDSLQVITDFKNTIAEEADNSEKVNLDKVIDKVFEDANIKQLYTEEIERKGINEKNILLNDKLKNNVNKKQRIETDNGFEIKIPLFYANKTEHIEFIINPDGTKSILIKNIREIKNR